MSRYPIYLVGAMKHQITGSKLPSNGDCLSVLFYNLRKAKMNLHDSAKLVIDECEIFWKKANIPTKDNHNSVKKLEKLYDMLRQLQKNKNRNLKSQRIKEENFKNGLNDLFDIAHADAMNLVGTEENKEFLRSQRKKGRVGYMQGIFEILDLSNDKGEVEQTKLVDSINEVHNIGKSIDMTGILSLILVDFVNYIYFG